MLLASTNSDSSGFSDQWWRSFLEQTENLSKPLVVNKCFTSQQRDFFETSVMQILRELGRLRTNKYGFRVFLEGVLLTPEQMLRFYDDAPMEREQLSDWVARIFCGKKFGIIINGGEKFVEPLSQEIAIMLAPLFRITGFPREGINYSIFIGNYDKTPIGIHQDKRGESVMHFHLGPAEKTMYLWGEDKYNELAKTIPPSDVNSYKAHATEYSFGPGDIFFMPEGIYHIGAQNGLSIGLTVWRYNHSNSHLLKDMHRRIGEQMLRPSEIEFEDDLNRLDSTEGLDNAIRSHGLTERFGALNYEDLIRDTYQCFRYALHSNAGYRQPPLINHSRANIGEDSLVQRVEPYNLLVRRGMSNNKMHVYARGYSIELNDMDCIENLINKINTLPKVKMIDLLGLLPKDWREEIGIFFVAELHKYRAVQIVG